MKSHILPYLKALDIDPQDSDWALLKVRTYASTQEIDRQLRKLSSKLTTDSRKFEEWLQTHGLKLSYEDCSHLLYCSHM